MTLGSIIGIALIGLFYLCMIIILFAPTIYAVWIYIVGRKVSGKTKGLLNSVLATFIINAVVVYVVAHLAFDYFVTSKSQEKDAIAMNAVRSAISSQKRFHASHGRYYIVGPIRGPYKDEYGLEVAEDVIIQVKPDSEKAETKSASFKVYAVHVWGNTVAINSKDGNAARLPQDSKETAKLRSKLLNAVK